MQYNSYLQNPLGGVGLSDMIDIEEKQKSTQNNFLCKRNNFFSICFLKIIVWTCSLKELVSPPRPKAREQKMISYYIEKSGGGLAWCSTLFGISFFSSSLLAKVVKEKFQRKICYQQTLHGTAGNTREPPYNTPISKQYSLRLNPIFLLSNSVKILC